MSANPKVKAVVPYLIVKGAAGAIDFYGKAFGARELYRLVDPVDQRIGHAELAFGDSLVMLADEYPDFGAVGPETIGGSPVKLHLDVQDADAAFDRAVRNGGTVLRPLRNEFHGARSGLIGDPFGYAWFVSQKVEDLTPAEMQRRWSESTAV
jgi:uncharacterized glyoxalase superfamily protein PhnB